MDSGGGFVKELTGRAILVGVCAGAFLVEWWGPLVVGPLFWQVWETRSLVGERTSAGRCVAAITSAITRVLPEPVVPCKT